jgi:hypothetical protein
MPLAFLQTLDEGFYSLRLVSGGLEWGGELEHAVIVGESLPDGNGGG